MAKTVLSLVRGAQGSTDYYTGAMDFSTVAEKVVLPDSRRGEAMLQGTTPMQRRLNQPRVRDMANYILEARSGCFFTSLTLIVIPVDLQPLIEDKDICWLPDRDGHGRAKDCGDLELNASVFLFPADGQHRTAAIQMALEMDPTLATETVPIVLIPWKGEEVVQQLFSDLNLNAKVPSRTQGLSFEHRDVRTLVAKWLAEDVPLFKGRVNAESNSLGPRSPNVITLNTLDAAAKGLISAKLKIDGELQDRLDDAMGSKFNDPKIRAIADQEVRPVIDTIIEVIPEWQSVLEGVTTPARHREDSIAAFGVAWNSICRAAEQMIEDGVEDVCRSLGDALRKIDWAKNAEWAKGLVVLQGRVSNTSTSVRGLALFILQETGLGAYETGYSEWQALQARDGDKPN